MYASICFVTFIGNENRVVEDLYPLRSLHESLELAESWWAFLQLHFEMLCKIDNNCSIAFELEDIAYNIWRKVQAQQSRQIPFYFIIFTSQTFLEAFLSPKGLYFWNLTYPKSVAPESDTSRLYSSRTWCNQSLSFRLWWELQNPIESNF
jgi:hypothetical protein